MAADIQEKGNSIEIGGPHALFQTNAPPLASWSFDVTADGQKFVVMNQVNVSSSTPITLAVNWPALLKKE